MHTHKNHGVWTSSGHYRTYHNSAANRRSIRRLIITMILGLSLAAVGIFAAYSLTRALYPIRYAHEVEACCEEFGVSESLAYAVIHTESGFDTHARSDVGALGLMQIMPETFEWLQTKLPAESVLDDSALLLPEVNIRYGVFFLSLLDERFDNDTLTVAAYHAGLGRVSEWLRNEQLPPNGCSAADIPSATTGHYVAKVERSRAVYLRLYSLEG